MALHDLPSHLAPSYGPLVEVCRAHGIGRTVAFDLAAKGVLETFKLGAKRYVTLDSVRDLPARIAAYEQKAAA